MPAKAQSSPTATSRLRATALLELTKDGHARLIPIALKVGEKFYDAGLYRADPSPWALDPGVVYEAMRAGDSVGLFTITHAAAIRGVWIGWGQWRANNAPVPEKEKEKGKKAAKSAAPAPEGENDDDRPILRRPKPESQNSEAKPGPGRPGSLPTCFAAPAYAGRDRRRTSGPPPGQTGGDGSRERRQLSSGLAGKTRSTTFFFFAVFFRSSFFRCWGRASSGCRWTRRYGGEAGRCFRRPRSGSALVPDAAHGGGAGAVRTVGAPDGL